jgi:hypothetical protein
MGLGLQILFNEFLVKLQIDETIYLFALHCTLCKLTLIFYYKPCDIWTNVFNIHAWPLWDINIDAQFIIDPYANVVYYIFYFKN